MTWTDFLEYVRVFNFFWGLGLFLVLNYYGVLDILLNRRCFAGHHIKELQMWANCAFLGVLAALLSMGEIFLTDAPVGWRVFSLWPFFFLTTLSSRLGVKRVVKHRRAIARGECNE